MLIYLKRFLFPFLVFITGATDLVLEILALRILSPFFGNSIFTATSVISTILGALSLGYYVGGRLADKYPSGSWFFRFIGAGGVGVIGILFLKTPFLTIISNLFPITYGPLIASLALFFIPSFLLGMLSPFAVILQKYMFPELGTGANTGEIFFFSTFGSIAGTLTAGFFLIPNFGINNILIGIALFLFSLSIIGLLSIHGPSKDSLTFILLAIFSFSLLLVFSPIQANNSLYSGESLYNSIRIYEGTFNDRKTRFLKLGKSSSGGMFLQKRHLYDFPYTYLQYFEVYKAFQPQPQNALFIGGGAYSLPKSFSQANPHVSVDVTEIDPKLFELSKKYFNLSQAENLTNHVIDGRRHLRKTNKTYDLIYSDAFHSLYSIPAHLTTKEFFQLSKERLNSEGVFMANIIGRITSQKPALLPSEIKTFNSVFEHTYYIAVEDPHSNTIQNIVFIGYKGDNPPSFENAIQNMNTLTGDLSKKTILANHLTVNQSYLEEYRLLTDNYAPVDYLTSLLLKPRVHPQEQSTFSGQRAYSHIKNQLELGPRFLGSSGHQKTQDYIRTYLEKHNIPNQSQTWTHISYRDNSYTLSNIVARISPQKDSRVILGTHYDSKKHASNAPQKPVPGANDSASGTATLLELARILTQSPHKYNLGIDLVFFDGEEGAPKSLQNNEWKPIGSTYFSNNLSDFYSKSQKPKAGIIIDMVCDKQLQFTKEQYSEQYAPSVTHTVWALGDDIFPQLFISSNYASIKDDHIPLNKAGIPSTLLIDFQYPPFHTTRDTIDKCSPKSLKQTGEILHTLIQNYNH